MSQVIPDRPNAVALSVRQGRTTCAAHQFAAQRDHGAGPSAVAILGGYRQRHLKIRNAANDAWISPLDVMAPADGSGDGRSQDDRACRWRG